MKAVILVNPYLNTEAERYQPRRIAEELSALGVSVCVVPNRWTAHTERDGVAEALSGAYDFCVYLDKDKYIPRVLERQGMRLFDRASAVEICDDKILTHIALAGAVPMPRTYFSPLCYKADARADGAEEAGRALGYPVVVKECLGSLGQQVYLAEDEGGLAALSERLKLLPHLYQEFIAESAGRDLRAVCVGGEVVACMERRSEGDFRSNLAAGGRGIAREATDEVRALCRTVCERLSLDYCGVDLLFGKDRLLVCEVNSNAFFGGIESATGVNVARAYCEHMVRVMRQ